MWKEISRIQRRCWASNLSACPIRCTRFTSKGSLVDPCQFIPGWWNIDILPDDILAICGWKKLPLTSNFRCLTSTSFWNVGDLILPKCRENPYTYHESLSLESLDRTANVQCSSGEVQLPHPWARAPRGNHTRTAAHGPTCRHSTFGGVTKTKPTKETLKHLKRESGAPKS